MSDRIMNVAIRERPDFAARLPAAIRERAKVYTFGECRVIVTHDGEEGWHLSISCEKRDPTWDEIATARYKLLADVPNMAMYLPALAEYVNLHPFTFRLYEAAS